MFTVEEELLINYFNSITFTYNEERQAYEFSNSPLLLEQDIVAIVSFPNLKFWYFLQIINLIKQDIACLNCDQILTKLYSQNEGFPFFRCNKRTCQRKKLSALTGPIF